MNQDLEVGKFWVCLYKGKSSKARSGGGVISWRGHLGVVRDNDKEV